MTETQEGLFILKVRAEQVVMASRVRPTGTELKSFLANQSSLFFSCNSLAL